MRALLGLLAALSVGVIADAGARVTSEDANEPLADAWGLSIQVDEPALGRSLPEPRLCNGSVALLPLAPTAMRSWMALSHFSYAGLYTDSFRPAGLIPSERERIPLAAARMIGSDSVEIVLNPTQDHGAMVLRGVLRAGRVTGDWEVTGYVRGARGTFQMVPLE